MSIISNKFLLFLAFISGLTIMAMEISAARLMAPYFGNSLFVWTNIIGVVLIALSLGYYFGGKLADRQPQLNILLRLILAAGIIFLVIPWIVKPLTFFVTINILPLESASVIIFIGSFIVSLLLLAFPIMLLGMVSPFIIKLYSLSNKSIGEVAGSVFAVSTVGSILGTFLPTLWFIPTLGTRVTISLFAIILIAVASWGLVAKKLYLLLLLLLFIPLSTIGKIAIKVSPDLIFEDESAYQFIQVTQDKEKTNYLIFNEGGGIQSVYNAKQILTQGMYYDFFTVLPYLIDSGQPKEVLILGLAGGTISRQLDYFFRDELKIDGVEIDKKVIKIAKQYFSLENPSLTVYNQDGRIFLQYTNKKYDLIIVDAYSQELYIPWTLTTQEFWRLVKSALTPAGLIAINVNSISNESELLQAIANTMASVFKYSFITRMEENEGWNYMLIASQKNLSFQKLPALVKNKQLAGLANRIAATVISNKYDPRKLVLTDDRAPIEFMTEKMIFQYFINNLNK